MINKKAQPIIKIDPNTGEQTEYLSLQIASELTGINKCTISSVANGSKRVSGNNGKKYKSLKAGGFKWRYK